MAEEKQHYVWQHYIRAWCNNKGQVHFKRKGQGTRVTNTRKIMVERGFYKLHQLDEPDIKLIEWFVERSGSPALRQTHRQLVEMFVAITKGNELIQSGNFASPHEKEQAHDLVVRAEDMLHSDIEIHAIPILDDLRHGRKGFINSDESAATFFQLSRPTVLPYQKHQG